MSQWLIAAALGMLIAAAPGSGQREDPPRPNGPTDRIEKTDPSVDRSLTGIVDSVDAKDENNGKLTLHTSPPDNALYRYVFQIDEGHTKLLTADGNPLKDGLKSRLLLGAEVRVGFVEPGQAAPYRRRPDCFSPAPCRSSRPVNEPWQDGQRPL